MFGSKSADDVLLTLRSFEHLL